MNIKLSPGIAQLFGGVAGIAIATGIYAGMTELSYLPAQALEPTEEPVVEAPLVAPPTEQEARLERIADRVSRAMEQNPRRLAPTAAATNEPVVHPGADLEPPRRADPIVPREAPSGSFRRVAQPIPQSSSNALPDSGPALFILAGAASVIAGFRASRKKQDAVS